VFYLLTSLWKQPPVENVDLPDDDDDRIAGMP
jgi:hypothetical protein